MSDCIVVKLLRLITEGDKAGNKHLKGGHGASNLFDSRKPRPPDDS